MMKRPTISATCWCRIRRRRAASFKPRSQKGETKTWVESAANMLCGGGGASPSVHTVDRSFMCQSSSSELQTRALVHQVFPHPVLLSSEDATCEF